MTAEFLKLVGERIAEARKTRGLSQDTLAQQLDKTRQALSSWEKGTNQIPLIELEKVARFLDFPISYFFGLDLGDAASIALFQRLVPAFQDFVLDTIRQYIVIQDATIPSELKTNASFFARAVDKQPMITSRRNQAFTEFSVIYEGGADTHIMLEVETEMTLRRGHFLNSSEPLSDDEKYEMYKSDLKDQGLAPI